MSGCLEYRWYAIQTTAGHENKVAVADRSSGSRTTRGPKEKLIRQALVPTQEVVEIKNGKKVTVERKLYPGYVLVRDGDEPGSAARRQQHPGRDQVRGHRARLPQPLRQDEVNRLLGIAEAVAEAEPKEEIPFLVGQVVEITEGPFSDFSGDGGRSAGGQGQGEGVGDPVRPADVGGAGLPAVEGALGASACSVSRSVSTRRPPGSLAAGSAIPRYRHRRPALPAAT